MTLAQAHGQHSRFARRSQLAAGGCSRIRPHCRRYIHHLEIDEGASVACLSLLLTTLRVHDTDGNSAIRSANSRDLNVIDETVFLFRHVMNNENLWVFTMFSLEIPIATEMKRKMIA